MEVRPVMGGVENRIVAGDECLGGLFVGEKGWMVGWVMERRLGKCDCVRVRERQRYRE